MIDDSTYYETNKYNVMVVQNEEKNLKILLWVSLPVENDVFGPQRSALCWSTCIAISTMLCWLTVDTTLGLGVVDLSIPAKSICGFAATQLA